jgi:nucleosome assembly protein 1-like 1
MKPLEGSRSNFVVEFEFNQNEYFTPNILTKTYFFDEETDEVEKTTGSSIQWPSQDKNPRVEVKTKKVKKGKSVETKKVESLVPSFFDIFADTSKDDPQANEEANFWKDDFFGNSLEYYLNIIDSDFFGEGEDFEGEEDEDDEDDEEKPKKAKKAKNPAGGAGNEKCKNQ